MEFSAVFLPEFTGKRAPLKLYDHPPHLACENTEHKPKNKSRGRPGNEARLSVLLMFKEQSTFKRHS